MQYCKKVMHFGAVKLSFPRLENSLYSKLQLKAKHTVIDIGRYQLICKEAS